MMVIFDFDQTLVDTSPVEHLRAKRDWQSVMNHLPKLGVYDGVSQVITWLHAKGAKLAIVTKSPDMVPKKAAQLHKWPIDIILGYHQVKIRKPHPEGLLLAMARGKADPKETYHVGDQPEDTAAARAAGTFALGSAWGIADKTALVQSNPDQIFDSAAALKTYFEAMP